MTRPWPTALAVREGLIAAVSAGWLSVVVIAASTLVMAGIGLANALDVSRLAAAEREWIEAGGYAYVVEPGSTEPDASLTVASCERLAEVDGIAGSFAISVTDRAASVSSAPGTRATWVQVSPGIFQFFSLAPPQGTSVIATPGIVADTALTDGERTVMTVMSYDGTGTLEIAPVSVTTLESPLLSETIAGAYLAPELVDGQAQQCHVSTEAAHADTMAAYLAAALSSDRTTPAIVRPRLPENTYGLDFATVYDDRILGWAWAAGASVLAALWAVVQFTRRTRLAIYATFGAHAKARLTMQLTEWAAMTSVGALWGWAISLALALGLGADTSIALTQATWQILAAWCTATLAAILIGLIPVGTLLNALKDRT